MKNINVISAILLFGAMNLANAQETPSPDAERPEGSPPTGYFEIGLGFSQPTGAFANEVGGGYGGYALPGNSFNLAFGLPINHSNFGVALMYSYAGNPYDIDTYVDNIQVSDQTNSYYPYHHIGYVQNLLMAGLYATVPIQRLSIDFRVMGGADFCYLPESDYGASATSVTASNDFEWDTYSSNTSALAYDLGAGIRYRFWRTSIMAGIDFLGSDPMVNTTQRYTDQYGNNTYTHVGGTVPISLVSYSIGIGYSFR